MRALRVLAVLAGVWLSVMTLMSFPAAASAQGLSGSVTGVVKDSSGAVLPGVTVEVSSPALIEKDPLRRHRRQRPVPNHRSPARHLYR